MRLLVCGDRNWTDAKAIADAISLLQPEVVIEGDARGADRMAGEAARTLGIPVLRFPAKWLKHGKAAGPIRNQQMLDEGQPDRVLAFHDNITESKGTRDMIRRARKAGLEVAIWSHAGWYTGKATEGYKWN